MKRLYHLLVVMIPLMATTGCATSGYWTDRGRDAADVLTATVGKGAALGARVGPVKVALNYHEDYAGLRNGNFFVGGRQDGEEMDILISLCNGSLNQNWGIFTGWFNDVINATQPYLNPSMPPSLTIVKVS